MTDCSLLYEGMYVKTEETEEEQTAYKGEEIRPTKLAKGKCTVLHGGVPRRLQQSWEKRYVQQTKRKKGKAVRVS